MNLRRSLSRQSFLFLASLALVGACGFNSGETARAQEPTALPLVEVIPDAWPSRPRTVGYEYNQKNHHAKPDFIDRRKEGGSLQLPPGIGSRFRVVGVRIHNPAPVPLEVGLRFVSQGKRTRKIEIEIASEAMVLRHFAIREPRDLNLTVELLATDRKVLVTKEVALPKDGHVTASPSEAEAVARELDGEDRQRRALETRSVTISVRDDLSLPVEAHLLLLLEDGMMVYEGKAGPNGTWSGNVIPGTYEVFAFADVPNRTDVDSQTAVIQLPRHLVLKGRLEPTSTELALRPTRTVRVRSEDAEARSMAIRQLWITPQQLAPAFRYAAVQRQINSRARLTSSRAIEGGQFLLLTSADLRLQVGLLSSLGESLSVFLTTAVAGTPPTSRKRATEDYEEERLVFAPAQFGRLVLDPQTGAGPGERGVLRVASLDTPREEFTLTANSLHTAFVPAGNYRCGLYYELQNGQSLTFNPTRVTVRPGELKDLTPRPPFTTTLYYKPKAQDKKVQFWLCVQDSMGRALAALPRAPRSSSLAARFRGWHKKKPQFDETLRTLRWEEQQKRDTIDPGHMNYHLRLPLGDDVLEAFVEPKLLRAFNVEGASGFAPEALSSSMLALLPEVKRALDGCLKYLGLPDGVRQIHMEFDIFLPPGVGGLGGGGRITLDARDLFPITDGTDLLPGAFRHELGHNLGFGHDPYMLIGPSGVDEERFTTFGYRMLHASNFQQTVGYLEGSRHTETEPWAPGEGVFAALRLLHGPDVHRRMFEERRSSEQTLVLHGLSSIERIATLYSLVVDENVAWIFRAHGWPVFDSRVDLGGTAVRFLKKHPRQLNYPTITGFPLQSWWVYGPEDREDGPAWRALQWPGRFTSVDADAAPAEKTRRYLFFRRFAVARDTEVQLLCSADVQLELRVNGTAVGFLDASPQYRQPVHDELMLNQKRPFTVPLYRGENQIEVAVSQPPGSRGFFLEWITPEGKPFPLRLIPDGPPGSASNTKPERLRVRNPIYNGSFELGSKLPVAWVQGATEPRDSLAIALDDKHKAQGNRSLSLKIRAATRGALIQRVVVEPGKKYRLRAALRSENFDGEAYVAFFTGDLHDGQAGQTDPHRLAQSSWRAYEAEWYSGTSRVVYVACYVKGRRGVVGFDALELQEVR